MSKRLLTIACFACAVAVGFYIDWSVKNGAGKEERGYPAPRLPRYLFKEFTEDELTMIARGLARQTETRNGRLGVLSQGEKGLIVLDEDQDMKIIHAAIKALRERGADADYIYDYQLLVSEMGMTEEQARGRARVGGRRGADERAMDAAGAAKTKSSIFSVREGVLEALTGYGPKYFSKELLARMPEINMERLGQNEVRRQLLVPALKSYMDKHPEYRYTFVGFWSSGPLRRILFNALGDRFQEGWRYPNMRSLVSDTSAFPADLWRALEEKVMEVIPWIEEVHFTDGEGTDLRYSVTQADGEIWATRPYFQDYIMMYPLQATADIYLYADVWKAKRIKQHVAPRSTGIIVGSDNITGFYPTMRVTVQDGIVQKVEGGGRVGDEMRTFLEKRYREAQYPYFPRPGFLYVFQHTISVNPKGVRDYQSIGPGRAGLMEFGFGAESTIPEVVEYAEKNDLPLWHRFHMSQFFPTYEAKLRGTDEAVKVTDKGHLAALDDPEIRALASKYGKADEILDVDWVPAIPGINVPGDYAKDYGNDPGAYLKKEWQQIEEGKYPHMIDKPMPIY
ncbi:MAG: hypothetical protein HY315_08300 [Acidobacteria bacterium]|nr:hypothetical protein [Acidobacteriota bacterium]